MRLSVCLQVAADDVDEGDNGEIAYTSVLRDNNSLQIDNKSGWITVKTNMHIFDRESAKGRYQLSDESRSYIYGATIKISPHVCPSVSAHKNFQHGWNYFSDISYWRLLLKICEHIPLLLKLKTL